MNTIEQLLEGCGNLKDGATLKITGLVSSDESVKDITVTLLPPEGYRGMQREDWKAINKALLQAELEGPEIDAAMAMMKSLEKALEPAEAPAATRGPQYERDAHAPLYRLPSAPDAVYLLRLRKEGPVEGGTPPKGALPLAKFLLTRKLQLRTGNYIHAIKLQDGRFVSVEII